MRITLNSDDPEARQLVKVALENYALFNRMAGIKTTERAPHPGEDAAKRAQRVMTYERRAEATQAMADEIHVPPPAGQGRTPPPGDKT